MGGSGNAIPVLGPCFRPISAPSHSISSPASSARRATVKHSTSAQGTGLLPSMSLAVKPEPITASTRPGAWACSVASAVAVATTCRSRGVITDTPSLMREVRAAARARVIHGSARKAGDS
jgi:hypothetical protein